jgi:hypothetical protein
MGGSNNPENLVDLTPEEHYVAHQLLVKIYPHNFLLKNAAAMMVVNRPSNKLYGWIRRELGKSQSIRQSGVNNSQFGTRWVTDGNIEKKVNEDFVILEPWVNGRLSGVLNNRLKKEREREKIEKQKNKLAAKIEHLRFLHNMYVNEGFDGVKQLGYKHTQVNLVNLFSKYLPEFVPQNGRKRKVQQAPQ